MIDILAQFFGTLLSIGNRILRCLNEIGRNYDGAVSICSILINVLIALGVWKLQVNDAKKSQIDIYTSILEEASREYNKIISVGKEIDVFGNYVLEISQDDKKRNDVDFVMELWKLRVTINKNWVEETLHKYEKYEEYLDKYKNRKFKICQETLKPGDLKNFVEDLKKYIEKATKYQDEMLKEIPDLSIFIKKFGERDSRKVIYEMIKHDEEDFESYIKNCGEIIVDWDIVCKNLPFIQKYRIKYRELYSDTGDGLLEVVKKSSLPSGIKNKYFNAARK